MNNTVLEVKIKEFVENRIQLLESGEEDSFEKCTEPYLVVHYIPSSTFEILSTNDTDKFRQPEEIQNVPMLATVNGFQDPIPNHEGILVYSGNKQRSFHNCTQIFRNNSIEARKKIDSNSKKIELEKIEEYLKNIFSMSKNFFDTCSNNNSIYVFINFINITGYSSNKSSGSYNKTRLSLAKIVINNFDSDFESNFNLILKMFYNAFGEYRPLK